jgi:hypothetical protein
LDNGGSVVMSGGQVVAAKEQIGGTGVGSFAQTGGVNYAGDLQIKQGSVYTLEDGTLVASIADVRGTLDFAGGDGTIHVARWFADFSNGEIINAESATFQGDVNTLSIFATGSDPAAEFGNFNNEGVTYVLGTTLIIPKGQNITYHFDVPDAVVIQGSLTAIGGPINLNNDVTVSDGGNLYLIGPYGTSSNLTIDNGHTGRITDSGGTISVGTEYVGQTADGSFAQGGGTHTVGSLYLGNDAGSRGTYTMSGNSQLTSGPEFVGYNGTGVMSQSGSANMVLVVHDILF